jgi:hypothetical protein
MFKFAIGVMAGAGLGTLVFYVWMGQEISVPLVTPAAIVEYCSGTPVELAIKGSRLEPRLSVKCVDRPCDGVLIKDATGHFLGASVPGIPVGDGPDEYPKLCEKTK